MSERDRADIRAVALDMDGTLLGPDHQISPFTIEVLNTLMDQGVSCIIATGRSLKVLEGSGQLPQRMYAVCLNGAQLAHLNEPQPLEQTFLPPAFARLVAQSFASFDYHLHAYVDLGDKLWCENADMELLAHYAPQFSGLKIFEPVCFAQRNCDRILKYVTVGEEAALKPVLRDLRQRLEADEAGSSQYLYAQYSMPGILELQDSRMNKGVGLARILHRLGLSASQLMAIGDGYNDVSMWELAKVPVVMGNAFAPLKRRGYYQAASHADDGAAQFLRSWFHLR